MAPHGIPLSSRRGPTTSQPLPNTAAAVWCLTVRRFLPLYDLPWVSLLEASLACKVPPLPRGVDEWGQSPLLQGLGVLCTWAVGLVYRTVWYKCRTVHKLRDLVKSGHWNHQTLLDRERTLRNTWTETSCSRVTNLLVNRPSMRTHGHSGTEVCSFAKTLCSLVFATEHSVMVTDHPSNRSIGYLIF